MKRMCREEGLVLLARSKPENRSRKDLLMFVLVAPSHTAVVASELALAVLMVRLDIFEM
jgi:hypothetical protein